MENRKNSDQYQFRMPPGMRDWLADQAARNASSINSEIIRCIRERMDRIGITVAKRKLKVAR